MTRRRKGEGSFYRETRALQGGRKTTFFVYLVSLGYDAHGRRVRRKFTGPTKAEARLKADQARAKAGGQLRARTADTVGEYLEAWLLSVASSRSARTASTYADRVRRFAIPNIGRMRLDELDAKHVTTLYATLTQRGVSADNIGKLHKVLRRAFNVAIGQGLITRNPTAFVERPKHRPTKRASYDAEQIVRFLVAADGREGEALFRLAVVTTMRPGELFALALDDLDLDRGHLDVRNSLEVVSGKLSIVPAKADSARRIPLTPSTVALLRRHLVAIAPRGSRYVFPSERGAWMREGRANAALAAVCAAAGTPRLTMYGLRHTGISLFGEAGVHLRVAADIAGHSDTDITANVYTHAGEAMHREGIDRVEAMLDVELLKQAGTPRIVEPIVEPITENHAV